MKLQAPTSKLQRNSKLQPPSLDVRLFRDWSLRFLWMLVLGVWSFNI